MLYVQRQSSANDYPQGLPSTSAVDSQRMGVRSGIERSVGLRLSHRSPRSTTDRWSASAGRPRSPGSSPEGAQGADALSDPTSARRPAMDRPKPRSAPKSQTLGASPGQRSAS